MKTVPSIYNNTLSTTRGVNSESTIFSQKGGDQSLTKLSQGQFIKALVVEEGLSSQFMLEVGGRRLQVESKLPLRTGQVLDLQVVSTGAKVELQVVPQSIIQIFGRSFAANANSLDLSSFFTTLRQVGNEPLQNLNITSIKALGEFSLLQQQSTQTASGQAATTGSTSTLSTAIAAPSTATPMSTTTGTSAVNTAPDFGHKILSQIIDQLSVQLTAGREAGKEVNVLPTLKTAFQDISLLFQEKADLPQAALARLESLPPAKQQIFQFITQLQQDGKVTKAGRDNFLNRVSQAFAIPPGSVVNPGNTNATLNVVKTGLSDLLFLLKGPETILQLFPTNSLQSGLLSPAQVETFAGLRNFTAGAGNIEGEQLQQMVAKLGLGFEKMLSVGNKDGAAQTVKAGLMDLVQNFMGQTKIAESGAQSLNTIEFLQLTQLQMERQDTLVLPLPVPFLDQGYLVIEDYKKQLADSDDEKQSLTHFSLYLKLSPLGNLKVDFLYSGDGVYIRFNSESKEISEFIEEYKADLDSAISNTLVHGVSFSEGGEDPLTSILKSGEGAVDSILDTKV